MKDSEANMKECEALLSVWYKFYDGIKRLGFKMIVNFITNGNSINSVIMPKMFGGNNDID